MCNSACENFIKDNLTAFEVFDKSVLEVGSKNVNGTVRHDVMLLRPKEYIGVDIEAGDGVDEIVNAYDLVKHFGEERFDIVISTEMVEHVQDWVKVFDNMKRVLKPNGILLITTRDKNSALHSYPIDCWRYEEDDFIEIFKDFESVTTSKDSMSNDGTFVRAVKPVGWTQSFDMSNIHLLNIITKQREPVYKNLEK